MALRKGVGCCIRQDSAASHGNSGGGVLLDLLSEIIDIFGAHFYACLIQTLFKNMADVILDVAQPDVVANILRDSFHSFSAVFTSRAGGILDVQAICYA